MEAKREMKLLRNWTRQALSNLRADPYCTEAAYKVNVRFVKWDRNHHAVLVCVRDTSKPETPYNSQFCRWDWVYTCSVFAKSDISRMVSQVMCAIHHPELTDYPF